MLSTKRDGTQFPSGFQFPAESIGELDADVAARVIAASSDVSMVIDRDGIIRDVAISPTDLQMEVFEDIVERRWIDTVTLESRPKVEEMLREALDPKALRWREINQKSEHGSVAFRFVVLDARRDGRVIALGRDLRGAEIVQQRLLQAQQAMERNYAHLRQAETRYRVLFQIGSEAVLIIDPASNKIIEGNPAAGALLGVDHQILSGKLFEKLFSAETRGAALSMLSESKAPARAEPVQVQLSDKRGTYKASASLFRQDGSAHVLVSLSPTSPEPPLSASDSKLKLLRVLNRIPDAFVVTDEALNIVEVNLAFLELAQIPSAETAKGQPMARFIGRPGVDLKVLTQILRDHGSVRNFRTIAKTVFGDQDEVELSGVAISEGLEAAHGFIIRPSRFSMPVSKTPMRELPRTAEQLMQLVGQVSLREIVAETTEVIERMCIEAALNLTGNNRASAAEILGVSRQSLYSKLNRHGGGMMSPESSNEH